MKVEDQQDLQDYDYYEGYYDGTLIGNTWNIHQASFIYTLTGE